MFKHVLLVILFFTQSFFSQESDSQISNKSLTLIQEAFDFTNKYGSQIWPEWNKKKYPLLYKTAKHDYLINHPNPPEDYVNKYYDDGLNTEVFIKENKDCLMYQAAFPVNGVWTAVMTEPGKDYDVGVWLLKFAHECFHLFQYDKRKERIVNPFTGEYSQYHELSFPYEYESPEVNAAARLEAETLFNSIVSDTSDNYSPAMFSKLFDAHLTVLKAVIQDSSKFKFKQWMEWNEGVARYTERQIARLLKEEPGSPLSKKFEKIYTGINFRKVWEDNYESAINPVRFVGEGVKGRAMFYYSGMGKAYYLDKVYPQWKERYFEKNLDEMILQE